MNEKTFIERPIDNEKEDLFNIASYVNELEKAINDGAKFIAIDGEYGSGKSSLVNMLESHEKAKDKKTTFVNVNFLNINEEDNTSGNMENKINNYHRYFVNQVANDICDDPFEIEQLFYHSFISYSVTNPSRYKIWKIIVDKLLLIFTAYMIIFLSYKTLFQNIEELNFVFRYSDKINPIVLIIMFVLVIIYGYGIYKPDKQERSPMLEIDKCRNIFSKVVNTKLNRHLFLKKDTNLFLVIDDLDRIDEKLQVKIISLLYNEYYPLKLHRVNIIFVFMLNTHKIQNQLSENNLSIDKLFDYILPVSNNQKHIIRHLTNKMINEHIILDEIFNNDKIKNREYIINIICKKYNSIRKIKHFFNKLISKYNYIKNKGIVNINYDEMIIISMLLDEVETSNLDDAIANIINNEPINDSVKNVKDLLDICNKKKIFDIDYYVYLYNFIDKNDMFNHYENEIYSISEKGYEKTNIDEDKKIINYLENGKVRYDKIFHEIFIFLDNDTKLIFTASGKFCKYLIKSSNFFENIDITNAYQNDYGYCLCDNIVLTKSDKDNFILDLKTSRELYMSSQTSENYNSLKNNFIQFLEKMDNRILKFNLTDYFSLIKINDDIYKLLFEDVLFNNMNIGFYLIDNNIIDCSYLKEYIDIAFMIKIDTLPLEVKTKIKKQILFTNDIKFDVLINIICDTNTKYDNIEKIYDKINQFDNYIPYDKLILILDNYGYNEKLDKHIIKILDDEQENMINFINRKHYLLSKGILDKLNSISAVYQFTNYYEDIFVNNGFYSLYIYSRILKNKKFNLNNKLNNNEEYEKALLENYRSIDSWASKYPFTKEYTFFILERFDFNTIFFNNENFWKITGLILNADNLSNFRNILEVLNMQNQLENFFDYCIKNKISIKFIEYLRSYAEEFGMSRKVKIKLTKGLNKIKSSSIKL